MLESLLRACRCGSQCRFWSLTGVCGPDLPRIKASRPLSLWALISRHLSRGSALISSMDPVGDNGYRQDPFDPRANPRLHNHHQRPAATAQDRRPLLEQGQRPTGSELQQQVQQSDQPLAVRMQKAEVARPPKAFG